MNLSFASSSWVKSYEAGDTSVWKSSFFPKTYVSKTTSKSPNKLAHEVLSKDFVKIQYQKKSLLNLVGVSNWRIRNFNWNPSTRTLNSYGFYTDHNGVETIFRERQVYKLELTTHYLVTTNKSNLDVDVNKALENFVKSSSK